MKYEMPLPPTPVQEQIRSVSRNVTKLHQQTSAPLRNCADLLSATLERLFADESHHD